MLQDPSDPSHALWHALTHTDKNFLKFTKTKNKAFSKTKIYIVRPFKGQKPGEKAGKDICNS